MTIPHSSFRTDKLPISLAVITANEERNLERCLNSADFCAEVVVVDSGSTDRTVQIAEEHGARVFRNPWPGYVVQKNLACAKTTHPWILCLDADEVVSPELRRSIQSAFEAEPKVDGFELNRHSYYGSKLINHSGWYPQWRLFLFRRGAGKWGGPEPHAQIQFSGNSTQRLIGDLFHFTYRDIRHHVSKNIQFAHASAAAMHMAGRRAPLVSLWFRPPWAAFRCYVLNLGVLDGFYGAVIATVSGFCTFLKYATLREMRKAETPVPPKSAAGNDES